MHPLQKYVCFILVLAIFGCAGVLTSKGDVKRISAADLQKKRLRADVVVIDVRAEKDWRAGTEKIQGAVRENPSQVESWIGNYHKDQTLVFYCA